MATRPGSFSAGVLLATCLAWPLLLLSPAAPCAAGLRIGLEISAGSQDADAQQGHIWIDGQRLRIELRASPNRSGETLIFRGDRKVLWILDTASRTYNEIERDGLAGLAARVSARNAEVEARLASLPAEERALVEQMIPAARPVSREPDTVRRTDERGEIAGRPARRLELVRGEQIVGEAWVTDWKEMGVKRRQLRVFRSLAGFQRDLLRAVGRRPEFPLTSQPFEIFDDLDGFPLLIRRFEPGSTSETRFTRVEEAELDAAFFELPPGFARSEIP